MGENRPHITTSTVRTIIAKEVYDINILPRNETKLREGYIKWGISKEDLNRQRNWWYRDGNKILKLSDPTEVPNGWYKWAETNPGDIPGPSNPPLPTDPPPSEWQPPVWSPGVMCPDGSPPSPVDELGTKEYMLYMDDNTLYIRYWEPCAPDGPGYQTILPKATVLSSKTEIVAQGELFPPPGPTNENIDFQEFVLGNKDVVVDTPLTIHSSVRFNAHILRPASEIPMIGRNGEYYYQNDTPITGQATISFARELQIGDYIIITY